MDARVKPDDDEYVDRLLGYGSFFRDDRHQ